MKSEKQLLALDKIALDPELRTLINPKFRAESILRAGGYDTEQVRVAMDTEYYGNQDILAEAAEAIAQIVDGKTPDKNRKANSAFIQKILNYATDNQALPQQTFDILIRYAQLHIPVAVENATREMALKMQMMGPMGMPGIPGAQQPTVGQQMMPPKPTEQPVERSPMAPGTTNVIPGSIQNQMNAANRPTQ
jgi:hypothetical protein